MQLDEYLAVAYFQSGVSHFLLGRYEKARRDFDEAYTVRIPAANRSSIGHSLTPLLGSIFAQTRLSTTSSASDDPAGLSLTLVPQARAQVSAVRVRGAFQSRIVVNLHGESLLPHSRALLTKLTTGEPGGGNGGLCSGEEREADRRPFSHRRGLQRSRRRTSLSHLRR